MTILGAMDKKLTDYVQAHAHSAEPPFFALLTVNRVISKRVRPGETPGTVPVDVFVILFYKGIRLAATAFHAFTVIRNDKVMYGPPAALQRGDQVWVDVPMFYGDGCMWIPTKA